MNYTLKNGNGVRGNMAPLLSTLLVCFLSLYSFAQVGNKINSVLLNRDLNSFQQHAKSYDRDRGGFFIDFIKSRDLVAGYQELYFTIYKPHPDKLKYENVVNCHINIISQGNLIIYYHLESNVALDSVKSGPFKNTSYDFKDTARFAALKTRFQETFLAPLNEIELFDSVSYGTICSWNRELTPQQMQIKNWVMKRNTAALFKWLQSPNTEKQIYAVQGFHSLNSMGVKISDEAKRLISIIVKKSGSISTCTLIDHVSYRFASNSVTSIAEVVKEFNFPK